MLLSIGGSFTRVQSCTEAEAAWLWDYLSCEDVDAERKAAAVADRIREAYTARGYDLADPEQAAEVAASIAAHRPDSRIRLYHRAQRVFPTGLLALVRAKAPEQGFTVDEVDTREAAPRPTLRGLAGAPMLLRPYQLEALTAALVGPSAVPAGAAAGRFPSWLEHTADPGRGIIHVPTGGGKSRMAVAIAHAVPGRWLFLVHRSHLAADVRQRWDATAGQVEGYAAGSIGAGVWSVGRRFTVATLQTLYAHLRSKRFVELAEAIDGVIVDEAHVAPAETFLRVIQSFRRARYRIGLSGTPLARGDKRGLVTVGALGPVVYRIRPQELIDQGYLTQPVIRVVPVQQDEYRDDWADTYKDLVVRSPHRNGAVAQCVLSCEKPAMVFVESLEHGRLLREFLRAHKVNTEFVSGRTPKDLRLRDLQRLADGWTDVLVCTKVFNEGVDVPACRSVIMAAAGRSEIAALQRVGRALRVEPGKTQATIYDFGDKGNPGLHDQAKDRIAAYQREGYPVVVDRELWPEADSAGEALHQAWGAMVCAMSAS